MSGRYGYSYNQPGQARPGGYADSHGQQQGYHSGPAAQAAPQQGYQGSYGATPAPALRSYEQALPQGDLGRPAHSSYPDPGRPAGQQGYQSHGNGAYGSAQASQPSYGQPAAAQTQGWGGASSQQPSYSAQPAAGASSSYQTATTAGGASGTGGYSQGAPSYGSSQYGQHGSRYGSSAAAGSQYGAPDYPASIDMDMDTGHEPAQPVSRAPAGTGYAAGYTIPKGIATLDAGRNTRLDAGRPAQPAGYQQPAATAYGSTTVVVPGLGAATVQPSTQAYPGTARGGGGAGAPSSYTTMGHSTYSAQPAASAAPSYGQPGPGAAPSYGGGGGAGGYGAPAGGGGGGYSGAGGRAAGFSGPPSYGAGPERGGGDVRGYHPAGGAGGPGGYGAGPADRGGGGHHAGPAGYGPGPGGAGGYQDSYSNGPGGDAYGAAPSYPGPGSGGRQSGFSAPTRPPPGAAAPGAASAASGRQGPPERSGFDDRRGGWSKREPRGGAAAAAEERGARRGEPRASAAASSALKRRHGSPAKAAGGAAPRARSTTPPPAKPKAPEYNIRVPAFSLTTAERDYSEIVKRYPKLPIPSDFSSVHITWRSIPGWGHNPTDSLGLSTLPADRAARVEHELCPELPGPAECDVLNRKLRDAAVPAPDGVRYGVRVLLLQGVTQAEREAVAKGPHHEGGTHLAHVMRFVTARFIDQKHKRGILGALGGLWDPTLDGGDPSTSDVPLQAAAIRHAQRQAGLDLSRCKAWFKVCEVQHLRPGPKEDDPDALMKVVMFCVLADDLMPGPDEWPAMHADVVSWRASKTAAEVADQKPGLTTKSRGTTPVKDPSTAASPAAKADASVKQESPAAAAAAGEGGGARGSDAGADADNPAAEAAPAADPSGAGAGAVPPAPPDPLPEPFIHVKGQHTKDFKIRTASTTLHSLLDYDDEDDDEATFELCVFAEALHELISRDYALAIMAALSAGRYPSQVLIQHAPKYEELNQDKADTDAVSSPASKKARVESDAGSKGSRRTNIPLLLAFRYFDRGGCGFMKPEDLRRLLHNAGTGLPHRVIKHMVTSNLDRKGDKLYYRDLTDKGQSRKDDRRSGSPEIENVPPPPPSPPRPAAAIKPDSDDKAAAPAAPTAAAAAAPGSEAVPASAKQDGVQAGDQEMAEVKTEEAEAQADGDDGDGDGSGWAKEEDMQQQQQASSREATEAPEEAVMGDDAAGEEKGQEAEDGGVPDAASRGPAAAEEQGAGDSALGAEAGTVKTDVVMEEAGALQEEEGQQGQASAAADTAGAEGSKAQQPPAEDEGQKGGENADVDGAPLEPAGDAQPSS